MTGGEQLEVPIWGSVEVDGVAGKRVWSRCGTVLRYNLACFLSLPRRQAVFSICLVRSPGMVELLEGEQGMLLS